jgi:ribosomal protein L12E/L44/L45/RPP1/RPP2
MRHLAAAMLLALAGKSVDEKSIKDVLAAAGVKVDDAKVAKIVKECEGKDVLKLAKEGLSKAATSSAPAKKEEPKVEDKKPKKEEKPPVEEEEDVGMGDLFG